MKLHILLAVNVFCVFGMAQISVASDNATSYEAFPNGYGYLQDQAALENAIAQSNRVPLRDHGWRIWAGIMQPADHLNWPIWYTWPNTTASFFNPDKVYEPCVPTTNESDLSVPSNHSTPSGILASNAKNIIEDDVNLPGYPIPDAVIKDYPNAVFQTGGNCDYTIKDGKHFQFNGDILIPTESLSKEAFDWIRPADSSKTAPYLVENLDVLFGKKLHQLEAPKEYIVTKHMYWPVKKDQLGVLPVWNNDFNAQFTGYAGYELWNEAIAIDTSGTQVGKTVDVDYLYGISFADLEPKRAPSLPIKRQSKVYGLDSFYHHQVTQADWDSFDDADKAILNASSYWAYNKPFAPGDYLVTIAMHINTKEISSWALQSVWWSSDPNNGPFSKDRPTYLSKAVGPWQHYELVDSYDITPAEGEAMPVAINPYIELVVHPVATNCQNCHNRAGWPTTPTLSPITDKEVSSSYQNQGCPSLLAHLTPNDACLSGLLLTDFQWIIPDRAF